MSKQPMQLKELGICCALGSTLEEVFQRLLQGDQSGMQHCNDVLTDGIETVVGRITAELPSLDTFERKFHSRNNQIALCCVEQIAESIAAAKKRWGANRIAVVIGTSTSGIAEGESALRRSKDQTQLPSGYQYSTQEMGSVSDFVKIAAGTRGPAFTISTACSSSAQALISAKELIQSGIVDAVICGGVDSLCGLTINGFYALESLDTKQCLPFSANRKGINIGEGGALFLMTAEHGGIQLLGTGSASDAYHMSAPHPEGRGARESILSALAESGVSANELGYINLHGTATPLNDAMESNVLYQIGAENVPASSTKALTGHTLGASGAIEAGICWLLLSPMNKASKIAPHIFDGEIDTCLQPVKLATKECTLTTPVCLSNSFAFGGSNVALVIGNSINE